MVYDVPRRLIWPKRQGEAAALPRPHDRVQRQMAQAARFGVFAALCEDPQTLFDEACRAAAEGMAVEFAKLLVFRAHERRFVLQAGVGWRAGLVGQARLDADSGTAAGFAWHSGQPVLCNDVVAEGRFRVPALLAEHGVRCSINVVVPGQAGADAFGVLEVEGRGRGDFRTADLGFLQVLAQFLASGVGRIAGRALHEAQGARAALDHQVSLGEIHHRVRNDLQGVCASVASEARATPDAAQRQGFARINGRLLALAGLYDHLLGLGGAQEMEFGGYLRVLCERIGAAGGLAARSIALAVEAEAVAMSRPRGLSLAVAVNELVSNAAEHAFAGRAGGRITVVLRAEGGGAVLSVADDGCGFSGPRPGGSGLGFVERLVQQAGGRLAREDGGGTLWRVTLPAQG